MSPDITSDIWMGGQPADWHPTRIKRVCRFSPSYSNGKPADDELCTVVPMEDVSESGKIAVDDRQPFADVIGGLNLFENGDVLFAKITPCMENGKGAFIDSLPTRYAFGSTEFHVLRPSHKVNGRFLYFYTFNPTFRAWAEKNMHGAAGQQRVGANFLKYQHLPLPDVDEQQRIADYLDASCEAIDRAVETKQKQLDTLDALRKSVIQKAVTQGLDPNVPMKDSGAIQFGSIPAHWSVRRIKDVFDFHNTKRVPLSSADRGVMTNKTYDYYGASGVIDKVDDYLFDGSFILLAEDGANLLTRSKTLAFLAKGKFWVNNHAHVFTPRRGCELFWVRLLESQDYSLAVTGSAQPKLTMENLRRIRIPVPPEDEQAEITEYLNRRIGDADRVRNSITEQIAILNAYRKSLIHECVTGKRRISEDDVAKVKSHV